MIKLQIPSVWERVSQATSDRIARLDAPSLSTDVDRYVTSNSVTYYTLINSWLLMWEEVSNEAEFLLLSELQKRGLISVIAALDADAGVLCKHVNDEFGPEGLSPFAERMLGRVNDTRLALQLLRFPKRFSPIGADILIRDTIKDWADTNRRVRDFDFTLRDSTLLSSLKKNIAVCIPTRGVDAASRSFESGYKSVLLPGEKITIAGTYDPRYAYLLQPLSMHDKTLYGFPYQINAGANAERTPSTFSAKCGELIPLMLSEGFFGEEGDRVLSYTPALGDPEHLVWTDRVVAVPKNYKTARIVAPQPLICNTVLYRMQRELRAHIAAKQLPIYFRDQLPNQDAARDGSLGAGYATLDLSKASDTIPKVVVEYLFPDSWVKAVEPWIPRYSTLPNGQVVRHGMWATSGSVITFPTETIWFWAVCKTAQDVVAPFRSATEQRYLTPIVYGDDILVDHRLAETVIDILRIFGQEVNVAKSYFDPSYLYRESCGVEYYKGIPLDTHYWPRNTLDFSNDPADAIASLIQLQHRYFSSTKVANFLYSVVKELKPSMTSSTPGTDCSDLWEVGVSLVTKTRSWGPRLLDGTKTDGEETISELHLCLVSEPSGVGDPSHRYDAIAEYLLYQEYLYYGPLYSNGLDELLKVSVSRRPANFSREVASRWRLQ